MRQRALSAAGIAALGAALLAAPLLTPAAEAGPRTYAALSDISAAHSEGEHRAITLPFSKTTVIELPRPAKDVIVANPEIVEIVAHTNRRSLLIGARPGQTNAFFYGAGGDEILSLDIRVERDIVGLHDLIEQHTHVSDAVEVQAVNNNLLLTGSVPNAATANRIQQLAELWLDEATGGGDAGEVVNLLAIEGRDQVMLKVRIVEMQRTVTKQLGINLGVVGQLGDATVELFSNNGLETGAGFAGAADWINGGDGDIQSVSSALQALERVGLVRTLAEPTLTAISGETASFLSGGEFPLLAQTGLDQFGNIQRVFELRPFGVSLGFTPVVLSEGRISLNISTEVSEPTTEGSFETGGVGSDVLGLRVRRAESVVEMPAGGSLVIAGLIREETRQASDGVPGVKDVPVLGAAFRNRDDQFSQQELMIIVTPYLVEPTHPDRLQTPLDNNQQANDAERVLLGRLLKNSGHSAHANLPAGGPFGHVVD